MKSVFFLFFILFGLSAKADIKCLLSENTWDAESSSSDWVQPNSKGVYIKGQLGLAEAHIQSRKLSDEEFLVGYKIVAENSKAWSKTQGQLYVNKVHFASSGSLTFKGGLIVVSCNYFE